MCRIFFLLPVVHEAQGGAAYADFRTEEWLEDRQASGHGGPGSEYVIDEKYVVYTFDYQCLVLAERESPMDIAAFRVHVQFRLSPCASAAHENIRPHRNATEFLRYRTRHDFRLIITAAPPSRPMQRHRNYHVNVSEQCRFMQIFTEHPGKEPPLFYVS